MICKRCGKELPESTRYCSSCGEIQPFDDPAVLLKQTTASKNKLWGIILGAIVLILVAAIAIVLGNRKPRISDPHTQLAAVENQTANAASTESHTEIVATSENTENAPTETEFVNEAETQEQQTTETPETTTPNLGGEEVWILADKANIEDNRSELKQKYFLDESGSSYNTDNIYQMTAGETWQYEKYYLNREFREIRGSIRLLSRYQPGYRDTSSCSTLYFAIKVDGETVYLKRFPERGELVDQSTISFSIPVEGAEWMTIRFFDSHDNGVGIMTTGELGIVDLVGITASDEEIAALPAREQNAETETGYNYFYFAKNHGVSSSDVVPKTVTNRETKDPYITSCSYDATVYYADSPCSYSADIAGKYSRFSGKILLQAYANTLNGFDTYVLEIIGDDQILYTTKYNGNDLNWGEIPFDVDISGVETLTVKLYKVGQKSTWCTLGFVDFLIWQNS